MERLCELVSARTAYSGSEVKGILDAFVYVFKVDLEAGFIIELEGLGTFYPAIVSKMEADEKGEKKLKVKVKTVKYRCSRSLRRKVELFPLIRVEERDCRKKRVFTPLQRKNRILAYVKKHVSITTRIARALNDSTKKQALEDIKALIDEKKILSIGSGKSTLYIKPYD
ncbi:MAG: HU family DNA-binding protein [Tannerellaceae bacterium]|nr:HU family DNA-binding protein [Tannerellaceae bacterium]